MAHVVNMGSPQCDFLFAIYLALHIFLVVASNIFYFHPNLGKIPMLTNIFQLGWNHQLVLFVKVSF